MQQIIFHLSRLQSCLIQHFLNRSRHIRNRKFIYFLSVHLRVSQNFVCLNQRIVVGPSGTGKIFPFFPVTALIVCHQPGIICTYHRCACTVPEQDTGTSVRPVHNSGKALRTNHESQTAHTAVNISIDCMQTEYKAGTGRIDIKRHCIDCPQSCLHLTGGGRRYIVSGQRSHHDHIQLFRLHTGSRQRLPGRLKRKSGSCFILYQMPFPDACSGRNPLIRSIHNCG